MCWGLQEGFQEMNNATSRFAKNKPTWTNRNNSDAWVFKVSINALNADAVAL